MYMRENFMELVEWLEEKRFGNYSNGNLIVISVFITFAIIVFLTGLWIPIPVCIAGIISECLEVSTNVNRRLIHATGDLFIGLYLGIVFLIIIGYIGLLLLIPFVLMGSMDIKIWLNEGGELYE